MVCTHVFIHTSDVPQSAMITRDETFGPVVALTNFDGSEAGRYSQKSALSSCHVVNLIGKLTFENFWQLQWS